MEIKKKYDSVQDAAEKVVHVLMILNNISLAEKELKVFTILVMSGSLTRAEWLSKFGGSENTFKNSLSKLKDLRLYDKVNDIFTSRLRIDVSGSELSMIIKTNSDV